MKSKTGFNYRLLALSLLLGALILAACGQADEANAPTATGSAPLVISQEQAATPASGVTKSCPEATAALQGIYNPGHGYCFLYPAEYKVEKPNPNETVLVIGGLLNAGDPRVGVHVEPAGERTAQAVADQIASEYPPDFGIERSGTVVAGVTAELLDLLPGQDMNRRVIFVHDGLLYNLMFSPVLDAGNQPFARLESLYDQVLGSFQFIPRSDEPVEECLAAGDGEQLLKVEGHGYCLILPTGYEMSQPNEGQELFFVGSILDVEHPRLTISVEDAAGRTADQAAEAFLAGFPPEFEIVPTGGVTIGYEPAARIDNVPGQDIGRVLFAEHDGRIYQFTFVPASEDAGDLFTQAEALYDQVLKSFRFLPGA
jgi:hypothetical protein